MRMLLDMDGVLADFDAQLFDELWDVVDWTESALRREYRFCTDPLPSAQRRLVRAHIEETRFFSRLPVIPGAEDGVAEMLAAGWDVWVCTKPLEANPWCASDKMAWIARHFPELSDKVILAPRKSMIVGDVLLDDAHKVADLGGALYTAVWYPYPHNEGECHRYWKWGDGLEKLEEMREA